MGDVSRAAKIGSLFPDLQLAYLVYDTGMSVKQISALPSRVRRIMRIITFTERLSRKSRSIL